MPSLTLTLSARRAGIRHISFELRVGGVQEIFSENVSTIPTFNRVSCFSRSLSVKNCVECEGDLADFCHPLIASVDWADLAG